MAIRQTGSLTAVIAGNALLRVGGGAGGVLVGLYLANLAHHGASIGAGTVGILGAISFGAELIASGPLGVLSDAFAPRWLMTGGALLGAAATQLFGLTGQTSVLLLSRGLEGVGAAAGGPAVLAHLTDATESNPKLRARVMSFYELSFLAGIAVGGVLGSQLWRFLGAGAFAAVAGLYLLSAILFQAGARNSSSFGATEAWRGLRHAIRDPYLRGLAPVWLCMNSIVGLWLGPTLTFLMTSPPGETRDQFLAGLFAGSPENVGWMMLGYALVFSAGVTVWSIWIPRLGPSRSLRIGLTAMPGVCLGLFAMNHSVHFGEAVRWILGSVTGLLIMVESGFTPAALSLLAGAVGVQAGRGAAMGIYSVLLSIGAIVGSLLAAWLGSRLSIDGLIAGTIGMALLAILLAFRLERLSPQ